MSRSRRRSPRVLLLLPLLMLAGAVLLGRDAALGDRVADALAPTAAAEAGQAFTDQPAADSAPPARPRRQIVRDVEVVVNIPSGRLELLEGGSVVRSYPVSVGSARYPTPVGDYLLATVIWNPWWNPPPESGWARNRKPEPPGPANPMGRVKLHMDELIYIHGTTSEGRLGAPASHGCIRMSNPDVVDLARRLHRYADPSVSESELDEISRVGRDERRTLMPRSIRMRVTYDMAELRDGKLHVFRDVYGRADGLTEEIRRELARGGLDTTQVPAPAMSRLRQSAWRGGASFALAEVPYLQPLPPLPERPAESSDPQRERGPRLLGTPVAAAQAPRDTVVIRAPEPEPAPVADPAVPDEDPAGP